MFAQLSPDYIRARPSVIADRLLSYLLFEGRPLTTRGRWINPLVFAAWRTGFAMPFRRAPRAPVFILGQGRSGTTLLGRIMGLHPDLCFLNEPKALWQAATGIDDLIGSYSATPGRYVLTGEDVTPVAARNLRRGYRLVSALSRRGRVLDKYPEMLFRDGYLRAVFPDARRVILYRDPWQVAGSVAHWSARHGTDRDDWWGRHGRKWRLLCDEVLRPDPALSDLAGRLHLIRRSEDRAALEWIATARATLEVVGSDPGGTLLISFDDLTRDPAVTLGRILNFCGLPDCARVTAYAVRSVRIPAPHPAPDIDPAIATHFGPLILDLERAAARISQAGT